MTSSTRGAVGCLIAALVVGCAGHTRTVRSRADGGDRRYVASVELIGNRAVKSHDIVSRLALRPPRGRMFPTRTQFDPLALRLDAERVVALYRARGYFAAAVEAVDVRAAGPDRVAIVYRIHEGMPTRIRGVQIRNAPTLGPVTAPALARASRLASGQVLVHERYLLGRDLMRQRLLEHGYAHADLAGRVAIDRDRREAWVRFDVASGPLSRFGTTRIVGAETVPESAIRARLAWSPGQRFDPDRIVRSQENLYRLGLFSSVRIDYGEGTAAGEVPMTVAVRQATRHELRLGGGLAVEQRRFLVRARAGYSVKNWYLPLTSLSFELRPGFVVLPGTSTQRGFTGDATAQLRKDDFLIPLLAADVSPGYEYQVWEGYSTTGPYVGTGIQYPALGNRLRLRLGWSFAYLAVIDELAGATDAIGASEPYVVGYYQQTALYDGRDSALEPARGVYAQVAFEEGGPWAAGRFQYVKILPELRGYVRIGGRVVLAAYARAGGLFGPDSPFTRRFYGGGVAGNRGFGFRRLSPMVEVDDTRIPIGGDAIFESSVEARVHVVRARGKWIGMAPFLDAGDVAPSLGELQVDNPNLAAGLGFSYQTIAGPVRLDLAIRLNRTGSRVVDGVELNPDPGSRFALHLNLGESF